MPRFPAAPPIAILLLLAACCTLLHTGFCLQECYTHSRRCRDSVIVEEGFECLSAGKFPHPSNHSLFLKCYGEGYKACACRCKYEHMCFDVRKEMCVLEFLDDPVACLRPIADIYSVPIVKISEHAGQNIISESQEAHHNETTTTTPTTDTVTAANDNASVHKTKDGAQRQNTTTHDVISNVPKKKKIHHLNEYPWTFHLPNSLLVHPQQNQGKSGHMQRTTISARQVAKPFKLMVHDRTSFPTWTIALVVLCVIILLVLIMLLMY